jgi:hypothetical protein
MERQLFTAVLLLCCLSAISGQAPSDPKQGPLQAEFPARINVRHLAPGATVFARVTVDWNGTNCVLRKGSIVEAKVELADLHKRGQESRLGLSFNKAQCDGAAMQPLNLLLAAVADAPPDWASGPDSQFSMPMSFSNPHGSGLPGFGGAAPGDSYVSRLQLRGIIHKFPMRPDLSPGAVVGLKDLKLDLGTGPDRSSVLSSRHADVSLGAFTQILLVPIELAFHPDKGVLIYRSGATGPTAAPPPAPAPPANTLDVCAAPGCAVDLPVSTHELEGRSAASIALSPLGYTPRLNKVLQDFDDEESLAWLGPKELLFAFNPHRLIHRSRSSTSQGLARIIRAVSFNVQTRSINRAVDWEITDLGRYLWQLEGGRVLAHIGNELRVYSGGLEVEHTIPLAGPLAFVRISPNGELMAIGTLRERHTPDLHSQLRESTGSDPEEDVEVAILNKDFNELARASTTSGLMAPTLLNEGQVELLAQPNMAYRLAMSTWDNKSTTLARFESRCIPQLSSMAPDLLFLLTCNPADSATEYRVLRADGKMLLRGKAGPREVGQESTGVSPNRTFAMKVVYGDRDLTPGAAFKRTELDSEEFRVYSADEGKRRLVVRLHEPPTSRGGFALSPDGLQLAVLSGTQVNFISVPVE